MARHRSDRSPAGRAFILARREGEERSAVLSPGICFPVETLRSITRPESPWVFLNAPMFFVQPARTASPSPSMKRCETFHAHPSFVLARIRGELRGERHRGAHLAGTCNPPFLYRWGGASVPAFSKKSSHLFGCAKRIIVFHPS